jgi:hypothetical protein
MASFSGVDFGSVFCAFKRSRVVSSYFLITLFAAESKSIPGSYGACDDQG